eukprot:TRINITY_DN8839_c0_g1_i1.p1 TRINITY_DN8839_c0_g1~~TRINITY_DN8839_c0_g1_i1.p1  ORF type:complete len:1111 (+),score=85.28 TRINITY_DN8839_c0_g1_i1:98-3430(+)
MSHIPNDDTQDAKLNDRVEVLQREGDGVVRLGPRFLLYLQNAWGQIKNAKFSYFIGFFCVYLVVIIVAVADTSLANTPVVFLNIAIAENGERDVVISPSPDLSGAPLLNYTAIAQQVPRFPKDDDEEPYLHSPRNFFIGSYVFSDKKCPRRNQTGVDPYALEWKYKHTSGVNAPNCEERLASELQDCFPKFCDVAALANIFVIDTEREAVAELGRRWELPPVPPGEAYVQSELAKALDVQEGDIVYLRLSIFDNALSGILAEKSSNKTLDGQMDMYLRYGNVYATVRVGAIFDSGLGKYAESESNGIILEYKHLLTTLAAHMSPATPDTIRSAINNSNPDHYAQEVTINLNPPRSRLYASTSNFDVLQEKLGAFVSKAIFRIGFDQVDASAPLLSTMRATRFFALFLGLILVIIVWILSFLSVLLIYSLLVVNVETRTFEMGVMRMLGMRRRWLVELLTTHAMCYALPAWGFGLATSQGIAIVLANTVFTTAGLAVSPLLRPTSIVYATLLGLGIPTIASIFPIRKALSLNLQESLDVRRSKTKAVEVSIERTENVHMSWSAIVVGTTLSVFGFLILYVVPLSLLSQNFALLLNVFFGLLLCMLLGLVLLSLNVAQLCEQLFVYFWFWWDRPAVTTLVRKNLIAHRLRNRKTSIMYASTVGFIIFIMVSLQLQIISFTYAVLQDAGSRLRLLPPPFTTGVELSRFEAYARNHSDIAGWAYRTQSLQRISTSKVSQVQNIGRVFADQGDVYGISPNAYDVLDNNFLIVADEDQSSPWSLGEQLYTVKGSGSMILTSMYRNYIGTVNRGIEFLLELQLPPEYLDPPASSGSENTDVVIEEDEEELEQQNRNEEEETNLLGGQLAPPPDLRVVRRRFIPSAFLHATPAFKMSKYPSVRGQQSLVSMSTMVRLTQGRFSSVTDLPIREVYLKTRDGMSDAEQDKLIEDLNKAKEEVFNIPEAEIWDYRAEVSSVLDTVGILNIFFTIVTVLAMVLCFFSLSSSMYTNIVEQTKEIAVLRAIGLTRGALTRVYIYEAFIVVFTASLLGTVIGTMVGFTMTLQRALFTLLPIAFVFPYQVLILVIIVAMVVAIMSAWAPTRRVAKAPIVETMRVTA